MSLVPITTYKRATTPRRSWAEKTHNIFVNPAPNKGLDVTQQLAGADPLTAITLENLIPRVYGCELRSGYSRHTSNLDGEVRTLMPFITQEGVQILFAATSAGSIYDVTAATLSTITPTPLVTGLLGNVTGLWSYVQFTSEGGSFLLAVCAGVGYYIYDTVGGWLQVIQGVDPGDISVDPTNFDYIWVWKNRVWFLKNGSASAWYLAVNAITGEAKEFNFGPYLLHGGQLTVGANWTVDGGEGIDDKLVLIGEEGDLLLYQGTDPDTADSFSMIGRWYIGHLPTGRRCIARYSQDMIVLCERGVIFLTELLRGQGFFENATIAERINPILAKEVSKDSSKLVWELRFLPHEQLLIVNKPSASVVDDQWVFEVNTKAFCTLSGIPMLTVEAFGQRTFTGDLLGNVWLAFTGQSDGQVDDVPGKDLEGTVVTAFSPLGEGVRQKRFLMVRPSFLANTPPAIKVSMNPDWSFTVPQGGPQYQKPTDSVWDAGIWNAAVWNGSSRSFSVWVGVTGIGFFGALSMKVRGEAGTTFASWQALVEPGGIL